MFVAALVGFLVIGAVCGFVLGGNKGMAALFLILFALVVLMGFSFGAGLALAFVAYGGGLVALAGSMGVLLGARFRKSP